MFTSFIARGAVSPRYRCSRKEPPGVSSPRTPSFLRLISSRSALSVPPASTLSFAMRLTRLITSCLTGPSGTDVRIEGKDVLGASLVIDDHPVHMELFGRTLAQQL